MTVPLGANMRRAPLYDAEDDDAEESIFYAGERDLREPPKTRGSTLLPACLLLLLAIGSWALMKNPQVGSHSCAISPPLRPSSTTARRRRRRSNLPLR